MRKFKMWLNRRDISCAVLKRSSDRDFWIYNEPSPDTMSVLLNARWNKTGKLNE